MLSAGPRLFFVEVVPPAAARSSASATLSCSAFSRRSARQVPAPAILLLSGAALLLLAAVGFDGIDRLLTGVVVIDGVFFAATALALFRLPASGRSLAIR